MCNDGTESPTCSNCHRGCCSKHGGCASNIKRNSDNSNSNNDLPIIGQNQKNNEEQEDDYFDTNNEEKDDNKNNSNNYIKTEDYKTADVDDDTSSIISGFVTLATIVSAIYFVKKRR